MENIVPFLNPLVASATEDLSVLGYENGANLRFAKCQ